MSYDHPVSTDYWKKLTTIKMIFDWKIMKKVIFCFLLLS